MLWMMIFFFLGVACGRNMKISLHDAIRTVTEAGYLLVPVVKKD